MITSLRLGVLVGLSLFGVSIHLHSGEIDKKSDATFVLKASESDLAEIELGKLAMKQAGNARVREFAAKMVKDHTKSSEELAPIAKKHGFALAKEVNSTHKDVCAKLKKLSGAQFDREYMAGQVNAHQKAVKLFMQQSKSGNDADLRAFARKTLPIIQEHYKMAQELAKSTDK
jgi:putative membrane protein